jgi:hypothetical protein
VCRSCRIRPLASNATAAATGFLIHNWFREQFQVSLLGPLVAFALAYQAAASGLQLVFVLVAACVAFG